MTNDLIQYLIIEAGTLLDRASSDDAHERLVAEAEELVALATRLLERRELTHRVFEYQEAA